MIFIYYQKKVSNIFSLKSNLTDQWSCYYKKGQRGQIHVSFYKDHEKGCLKKVHYGIKSTPNDIVKV